MCRRRTVSTRPDEAISGPARWLHGVREPQCPQSRSSLYNEVTPSVIAAGGNELAITGLALSTSYRVPIGSVLSFPSTLAVADYFGLTLTEARIAGGAAGLGSGYFGGFTNADALPGALLVAQYP